MVDRPLEEKLLDTDTLAERSLSFYGIPDKPELPADKKPDDLDLLNLDALQQEIAVSHPGSAALAETIELNLD